MTTLQEVDERAGSDSDWKRRTHTRVSTPRIPLGGVQATNVDIHGALTILDELIEDGWRHYVCFCESNLFVSAYRDERLRNILNRSSMTLPDGVCMTSLGKLLKRPLKSRVPGPSFLPAVCEHGLNKGYRHFFLGGAPGVADKLAGVLTERFPGLQIAGTYAPPFRPMSEQEEQALKERIEAAAPHVLWVGLGAPKQEYWIAKNYTKFDVPVMLGVGAAFDFHTGKQAWAPQWVRAIGMEWAFRMLTGGPRILKRNLRCVSLTLYVMIREFLRERVLRLAPSGMDQAEAQVAEEKG